MVAVTMGTLADVATTVATPVAISVAVADDGVDIWVGVCDDVFVFMAVLVAAGGGGTALLQAVTMSMHRLNLSIGSVTSVILILAILFGERTIVTWSD